jgi:adenylate kinase family enzyme/nucleoside-diphosphate-sugar epimerase
MSLPAVPKGVKKVFVAFLDTHFGAHFVEKLFATPGADYEVSGILRDTASHVNAKVKKVVRRGDTEQIRKALLDSDFIVSHTPECVDDSVKALRLLSSNHYELEKRFVLVSSVMSWFETPAMADAVALEADGEPEEAPEMEALTEDQYNRRVPHIKYQAWRDVEKLCCSCNNERLKTFVVFAGLMYGNGENVLQPLFKQAWTLAPEGLPMYGTGQQLVPMIHTTDCATAVERALTAEEVPESRYFFAVDDGNCSWKAIATALNGSLGNGKTFKVAPTHFGLHDNVEQFVVNLKIEAAQIGTLLPEETDWIAKAGFVENIDFVCQQFREARAVTPMRLLVLGPPSAGKSFAAREIASHYKLPNFTIADIVAEFKYQEQELQEEVLRIKAEKDMAKRDAKLEEKKQTILEERRAAADAAAAEAGDAEKPVDEDDDDIDEEDDVDVTLTAEEMQEIKEAVEEEAEGDEAVIAITDKVSEIKRILQMKLKPIGSDAPEPPNPKDKKAKPAPKPKKAAEVVEVKEEGKEVRLSDRALAFMVKWKLSRTECRNQGYVLDGFPKTIRQARLVFEDVPVEVPEDPEEADLPLDKEEKPAADSLMPGYIIHAKAGDTFLLERLLKTQFEHPHNKPEDFQRRLEHYKNNYDTPMGVIQYFESLKSTAAKSAVVKTFDMEGAPLVPPPQQRSAHAPRQVDTTVLKVIEFIGKAHNFGLTPLDAFQEQERARLLSAEQRAEKAELQKAATEREADDVAQAESQKTAEAARVRAMKDQERDMLEQRKGPLKSYLMANVIPVLTKGLIEVCNNKPDDPVDYLAEWLFKHNPEDHPELYC